jgi:hypothetical protein
MISLLLLARGAVGRDSQPRPACHSQEIPAMVPITLGESLYYPMEQLFKGYNL